MTTLDLFSAVPAAAVDTGVGSLTGWGAATAVLLVLAALAWWAARPARRRRR